MVNIQKFGINMIGLFKVNEDSAFGPGMMFGIGGPGPKRDTKGIPSDKSKEKGVKVKDMKKLKAIPTFEEFVNEEKLPGVPVLLNRMGDGVVDAMKAYFAKHKNAYNHEKKMSGIDPLLFPIEYFKYELREPEHQSVRNSVNKTGMMLMKDFEDWCVVNAKEESKRLNEEVVNQPTYKYPSTDVGSIVEVEGKEAKVVEILAYTKNHEANILAFTAEIDGDIVRVRYNDAKDGYEIYTTED